MMSRFLDGPAVDVGLLLRRAPLYLRVVMDRGGTWDALDQLDDTPTDDEQVHVYRREGPATMVHVDFQRGRGKGPRSAWYQGGDYRHVAQQPDEATMRDTVAWRAWCQAQEKERSDG